MTAPFSAPRSYRLRWVPPVVRSGLLARASVALITAWLLAAVLLAALVLVLVSSVRQGEQARQAALSILKEQHACESLPQARSRGACARAAGDGAR